MLELDQVKNTNPKSTNTHTKRGRVRFTRFGKMPTSLGQKRNLSMIYTRYKRITNGFLKNTLQKSTNPNSEFTFSIYREEKRP